MVVKQNQREEPQDLLMTLGLGYLGQFLARRINELVLADGKRHGFAAMRASHGYVIQHLVETNRAVARTGTELAQRMGVTQQAVSKAIAELVRVGVIEVTQAADRRAKKVRLTARGWEGVQYARKFRARIEAQLAKRVGVDRYAAAQETLRACLLELGGVERIRRRRVHGLT